MIVSGSITKGKLVVFSFQRPLGKHSFSSLTRGRRLSKICLCKTARPSVWIGCVEEDVDEISSSVEDKRGDTETATVVVAAAAAVAKVRLYA